MGKLREKQGIPEEMWKYIDKLELHVFEMRRLPEETRELFQSDMRIVADFLASGNSYHSYRKIIHKEALIKMIKVLSGESDTDMVGKWMEGQGIREEDEITVCELFDQYVRQGREEGEAAGRKEGIKCGEARQLVEDIEKTMGFFKVTLEKACESLGITVGRYEEAKRSI